MKKISKDYLNLQTKLHENPNYGTASISIAPLVKKLFEDFEFKSISDYGAGKKNLEKAQVHGYKFILNFHYSNRIC